MSFNLVDSIKSLLPNDLLNKASGMLGEKPEKCSAGSERHHSFYPGSGTAQSGVGGYSGYPEYGR